MYVAMIVTISKSEFLQFSCYKLMLMMAFIDMIAITGNSLINGVQTMLGLHYCTNPVFFYMVGTASVGKKKRMIFNVKKAILIEKMPVMA